MAISNALRDLMAALSPAPANINNGIGDHASEEDDEPQQLQRREDRGGNGGIFRNPLETPEGQRVLRRRQPPRVRLDPIDLLLGQGDQFNDGTINLTDNDDDDEEEEEEEEEGEAAAAAERVLDPEDRNSVRNPRKKNEVYIGQLPHDVTREELCHFIRDKMALPRDRLKLGDIDIRNHGHPAFAFVTFHNARDADNFVASSPYRHFRRSMMNNSQIIAHLSNFAMVLRGEVGRTGTPLRGWRRWAADEGNDDEDEDPEEQLRELLRSRRGRRAEDRYDDDDERTSSHSSGPLGALLRASLQQRANEVLDISPVPDRRRQQRGNRAEAAEAAAAAAGGATAVDETDGGRQEPLRLHNVTDTKTAFSAFRREALAKQRKLEQDYKARVHEMNEKLNANDDKQRAGEAKKEEFKLQISDMQQRLNRVNTELATLGSERDQLITDFCAFSEEHDAKVKEINDQLAKYPAERCAEDEQRKNSAAAEAAGDETVMVMNDSAVKEVLSSELECICCFDKMKDLHIYQCSAGHLICDRCHKRLTTCPVCRVKYNKPGGIRCRLAEQLAQQVTHKP